MSDRRVIQSLEDAAKRGVSVYVIMTYQSSWKAAFLELITSGVRVHAFSKKDPLYIHAKMVLVDDQEAFIGSQNFSATSLQENRELGVLVTNRSIIAKLIRTFGNDWLGWE
ncbi:MAG: phospholipase D-like domain-containing protein [Candidatus Pacebacteria bacterium]|nr:phospholipase D-like domain-containing protein [Candidatus Paceibacterota bacterium]